MSIGLIALFDDIAGLAKVAAASLDDVAGQTMKAGAKAAGVVIDDAAVTPRYVTGFDAARELPIVGKIAIGSLRNKLLLLLPGALALGFFAPWAITPLLMLGGAYLSYEGTEKVVEALFGHHEAEGVAGEVPDAAGAQALEDQKVSSAIKTDFILSAEIMAITLASVPEGGFWTRAIVLALVGTGITAIVYGSVALIVKADDVGLALARREGTSAFTGLLRGFGRGLVRGMPVFLKVLGVVGTAAMIWVGGGILVHGLESFGFPAIAEVIEHASAAVGTAIPFAAAAVEWIVAAAGAGIVGLAVGAALIPVAHHVLAPAWNGISGLFARR